MMRTAAVNGAAVYERQYRNLKGLSGFRATMRNGGETKNLLGKLPFYH
jgi:hypothetical protein